MYPFNLADWLKRFVGPRARATTIVKKRRFRLCLEELETRLAPALWTGAAGNPNWSSPGNWQGGIVPTVGAPVDIDFPTTATTYVSNNDIAGLTVNHIIVDTGSTYTITASPGDQIILGNPGTSTGLIQVNTGASAAISIDMRLGNAVTSTEFINVQSGASLTLSGHLSGSSAAQLTMEGVGILTLTNDNSSFFGSFNIGDNTVGKGIVAITNPKALGSPVTESGSDNPTTVATDAQLQVNLTADGTINNPLVLNGAGPGGTGALYMNPSARGPITATWAGNITMNGQSGVSNTTFGVADVQGTLTNASSASPIVITTASTAQLYTGEQVTIYDIFPISTTVPNNTWANGPWIITVIDATHFSLNGSTPGPGAYVPGSGGNWTATPYKLAITGQISNSSTTAYTVTKEGGGTLYLNPLTAAGNTYGGDTRVNAGTLSIGHPFALGSGGGTTIVGSTVAESGTLAIDYTNNPFIPAPYLVNAQVQTISLTNPTAGATKFTLNFNGAATPELTYTGTAADTTTIMTALNGLSTIGGVGATVSVSRSGTTFSVTFAGSLGGMFISTLTAAVTAGSGTIGVGSASGTTPIGFQVPNEFLTLNGPGLEGVSIDFTNGAEVVGGTIVVRSPNNLPRGGAYESTGALFNLEGANAWEMPVTFWSSAASVFTQSGFFDPVLAIGAAGPTAHIPGIAYSNLIIDGAVTDNGLGIGGTRYAFAKVGGGRVILTQGNTFAARDIAVLDGGLNLRDSNAMGLDANILGNREVWLSQRGASIELQADGIPDSSGLAGIYNLYISALTPLLLNGPGWNNEGALDNLGGVNKIEQPVRLHSSASVGVAPDPDPFDIQAQSFNDLSQLTIDGVISGGGANLTKFGYGELVLTNANTYTGSNRGRYPGVTPQTDIRQGWITIQNNRALGGTVTITDSMNPVVKVADGAALHLKQDLAGNNLQLDYNLVLSGTGFLHRFPWLNKMGALENLDGTNTLSGYIYLDGLAGIGAELDGANSPSPPVSELILSGIGATGGTILDGASAGSIAKLGSQRLIVEDYGTYTGGVDVRQGVMQIHNDTALGTGTNTVAIVTTVESGAALEMAPTNPLLTGGVKKGLQILNDRLILNGTGNTTFGDAPLAILANDNLWRGSITLNAGVAITFQNALAGMALPTMTVNNAGLTGGTVSVNTTTPGSSGINAVQNLSFIGAITGGSFTLTLNDGAGHSGMATIPWSANLPVLIDSIQSALNALAPTFLGTVSAGIVAVATSSPIINVAPNSRFIVTGVIDDGGAGRVPADFTVAGGGELALAGANTYRGTTFINQGIVTLSNGQALGVGSIAAVQRLTISGAVSSFNLGFNGYVTPNIAPDITSITNALNALPSIGGIGVGGSVGVTQAGNVFTLTFGGKLTGFKQNLLTTQIVSGGGSVTASAFTDGQGGTAVASGAQLQLQGGINVTGKPLQIQGQGSPSVPEIQTVTVGGSAGAFRISFTNPITGATSATDGLPSGASALQVQAALNQLTSIQDGIGAGGGLVTVNESGSGVYAVTFVGTFLGANNLPLLVANKVAEQILTVTGNSGSYQMQFFGYTGTTVPLPPNLMASGGTLTASSIQNALNDLLARGTDPTVSPGGGLGTASVVAAISGNTFVITFGGSLAGVDVPPLVPGNFVGSAFAAVSSANGATAVAGKLVQGGSPNSTPIQWFSFGPSPINNGQVAGNPANVAGRVTGVVTDPIDSNNIYISTAGGGAWRTTNNGKTWTPLFDGVSTTQTFKVTGLSGTFALTFTNPATGVSDTTPDLAYNSTADQVQAALNSLASISGAGGFVSVSEVTTAGVNEVKQFTLNGGVAGTTQFTLSFNGSTTAPILFTNTAADAVNIANALNDPSFAAIGGLPTPGLVTVTQRGVGIFAISFGGSLGAQPLAALPLTATITGPGFASVTTPTPGVFPFNTYTVSFSGGTFANVNEPPMTFTSAGGAVIAGSVSSATLTAGGSGYTDPVVTITGGGAGAAGAKAFATYVGSVTHVTFTNHGAGYTAANLPTVVFTGGGGFGAAGTAVLDMGVGSVSITAPGREYWQPPAVSFVGGGGTGAAGYAILGINGAVLSVVITNTGTGYTLPPTVVFTDVSLPFPGWPHTAATTATGMGVLTGIIGSVTMTSGGAGYTSQPTVTFAPPGGTPPPPLPTKFATGTGDVTATITGVVVTNGGNGYSVPPTVTISSAPGFANGTGAAATASIAAHIAEFGLGTSAAMYSGAIAIAPSDPATIYLGTGEGNNSADSYYGTGIYVSHDYGQTWNLVTDNSPNANPLKGAAINKIVVDPRDPNYFYAAVSDLPVNDAGPFNAGIWRYDGASWLNMTQRDFPEEPAFPFGTAWSDLILLDHLHVLPAGFTNYSEYTLYAAWGDPNGGTQNRVYTSLNPKTQPSDWLLPMANPVATTFPLQAAPHAAANGNIKLSGVAGPPDTDVKTITPLDVLDADDDQFADTIYASVANVDPLLPPGPFPRPVSDLLHVYKSTDGGLTWTELSQPPNYLGNQGDYDSTILAKKTNRVTGDAVVNAFVGGQDPGTGRNFVLQTTDGGTNWSDISQDTSHNGPHTDLHAMALDADGNVIIGSDGGVWRFNVTTNTWSDLNGNLAITELNGISTVPNNPNKAIAGAQDVGTFLYSGTPNWQATDGGDGGWALYDPLRANIAYHVQNGVLRNSTDGGATWSNTGIRQTGLYFPFAINSTNSSLFIGGAGLRFNSGPATALFFWTGSGNPIDLRPPTMTVDTLAISTNQGPFQVDPSFPNVIDRGANNPDPDTIYIYGFVNPIVGFQLFVSKDRGSHWSLRTPAAAGFIQDLAVDPTNRDTVYAVTGGFTGTPGVGVVFKSTDAGLTWTDISAGLPDAPAWRLVIDPRYNNLYLGNDNGVYELAGGAITSTNTWQRFGAVLPQVAATNLDLNQSLNILTVATYGRSAFQFYLDNATVNTGALRAASGSDVWSGPVILAGQATISAQGNQTFQNGIAVAQLKIGGGISDLTPNAVTYTLTKVGTGDVILSGPGIYSGVTLVKEGNLVVQDPNALGNPGSAGTQVLFLNNAVAGVTQFNLSFQGSITASPLTYSGIGGTGPLSDALAIQTALNLLDSISAGGGSVTVTPDGTGTGFAITFVGPLAGTNQPRIEGTIAAGPGASFTVTASATVVVNGAVLQLGTSLNAEALYLFGNGVLTSGHYTGALESVSNNNTYNGTITLETNSTIGVDAGSRLAITSPGTITDLGGPAGQFSLDKEGKGMLSFTTANSYEGGTTIDQGDLNIQNSMALGAAGGTTTVLDGAQLQLQAPSGATGSISVTTQNLVLSGYGDSGTGALLNNLGNNTWGSASAKITLAALPGFSAHTTPAGVVAIGVGNPANVLVIAGTIDETLASGLYKVGPGRLVLSQADSYSGTTYVTNGVLTIQDSNALGLNNGQAIQRITTFDPPGTNSFILTFGGVPTPSLLFGASALSVQNALNGLPAIIAAGGVHVDRNTVFSGISGELSYIYTVTFLVAGPQPLIIATGPPVNFLGSVATVADGGIGVLVNAGSVLQLDSDPNHAGAPPIVTRADLPLVLNGAGIANTGALRNLSGDNIWQGTLTLKSDSVISAEPTTHLTVSGIVQDPSPAPRPPANVTKVGAGAVIFSNANTYTGSTNINAGVLIIQNAQSLGLNVSAVQTVSHFGISGTFTLTFTGFSGTLSTGPLPFNVTGAQLQNALNGATMLGNASAPGGGAGTAAVTPAGASPTFTVTFGGSLAGVSVPLLFAQFFTGTSTASTASVLAGGTSRTTVNTGASLQLDYASTNNINGVILNGGSLIGAGSIGNVTGTNGTLSPGVKSTPTNGVITVNGNSPWGANSTFFVDLGNASQLHPNPAPAEFDQLVVNNGSAPIDLANVLLTGSTSGGVQAGDIFTILQKTGTGALNGNFRGAQNVDGSNIQVIPRVNGVVYIGGTKYAVQYNSDSIVLTVLQVTQAPTTTAVLAPTLNAVPVTSAVYGQLVDLHARVTSLSGLVNIGRVTFWDGDVGTGVNLGFGDVDPAGNASLANVRLPAGSHVLNASYHDGVDISFRDSRTPPGSFNFFVDKAQTATVLVSSAPGTSGVGQQVTYTATVTPQYPATLAGTVTFTDNGVVIGAPVNVSAGGVAAVTVTYAVGGTHTIQAFYNPPTAPPINFLASQSDTLTQMVLNNSQVNVAAVTNMFGQDLVYSLTVTSPQGGTPAGVVTVTEGGNPVAHTGGDLSGGATTITIASGTLGVGTHTLVFSYMDTSAIPAYASSSRSINQVISAAGTTVTFTPTPQTSAVYGTLVDYAGVVTGGGGIDPTDGTVKLYIDSTSNPPLATATLSGANSFSFTGISIPATFSVGSHTILAVYTAASPNFLTSPARTSPLSITQAFTQVSQPTSSAPGGSNYGQAVTFTVTVTTTNSPGTTPTGGTVSFYLNTGTLLGTVPLGAGGIASYTTTAAQLPVNTDAITAIYNGSTNFAAGDRSPPFLQIVSPAVIAMGISSSSPQSSFGQAVTFTAVVVADSGGRPTTGAGVTLIFTDSTTGMTYTGVLDPSRSTATSVTYTVTISTLSVDSHSITATYTDTADNHFASPVTSAVLTQIVGLATTSTVLTSLPGPAGWASDRPTTFTATVRILAGSGTLTGGNVTFWDGPVGTGAILGTGILNASGVATLTTTLTAGQHAITAVYDGTAAITGSTSNTQQNANVRRYSNLTLSSSPDPTATQPTTFTSVLTGAGGPLAGQTVTFTINGVDYTTTTDANGAARIDFTFADPGTYTVRVRFRNPLFNDADNSITVDVAPNGVLV